MEPLQELLIKQAIKEKLYTYCRSMDRMDNPMGFDVFTEDSEVDYGPHFQGSGKGFVEWVSATHKKMYLVTSHQMTNILIKVSTDGNFAVSETYLHTLQLTRANSRGKSQEVHTVARYLDEWSCVEGDWKIRHRRYVQDISEARNCEYDLGRFGGKRSHSDPSYELFASIS